MSATETISPRNDVESLLQELVDSENVEFSVVSEDGFFIAHLRAREKAGEHADQHRALPPESLSALLRRATCPKLRRRRFGRKAIELAFDLPQLG